MSYTRLTLTQIYNRVIADMEARQTGGAKIPTVSLLSVTAFGIAGGSYMVQGFLDWIYRQILPDLADAEGLSRYSRIYNLPQKASVTSSGLVAFTGTTGTIIPSGTEFQNQDGLAYTTSAEFTIDTTPSVEAKANESGADWNNTTGLELVQPLTGVDDTVTIVSGFENGVDAETFANWVIRILQRTQNPPSSGNAEDYKRWVLEVDGVGYAWIFPAEQWAGAGTVGVAASDTDFTPLGSTVLTNIENYLKSKRSIPSGSMTVYSPVVLTINYDISITPYTTAVIDAVTTNISDLFKSDAIPGGTMYISRTNSAISGGGASDYIVNDIEVDSISVGAVNFTTGLINVPVLGTITFSAVP